MKKSFTLAALMAIIGLAGANSASADDNAAQAQAFKSAKITMQAATDIALKEVSGDLSGISFDIEKGQSVYEATVVTTDGITHEILINADTGAILMSGVESMMGDNHDGDNESSDDGEANETPDADGTETGGAN